VVYGPLHFSITLQEGQSQSPFPLEAIPPAEEFFSKFASQCPPGRCRPRSSLGREMRSFVFASWVEDTEGRV